MNIIKTKFKDCLLIEPSFFDDSRGLFFETFKKNQLESALGFAIEFVQENTSISKKGVLRGLHFQKNTAAQAKLVTVQQGEVLDVVVDLRPKSETFKQHLKFILSDKNHNSLFIPKGMAHGFLALTDNTVFNYKCDNYYNPQMEAGIIFNDSDLEIEWDYPINDLIISKKDLLLPSLKSVIK
ncbi:dTDP-4-dehydrorhamnose 3,5-epimerase [Maribacter hydrothermalis]|uniref:dTDP-4-dehydrorhamnose 3,5-epimerase n=1 Tax=Maribacter hydrothermalis TaxID=1836467 RepID=A0A1B7ZE34_9FLAO|nr:dTDP-4-dehydrorhamnose 3,5-epimerase [Maribacter hydrothermalis]APQ17348.1 dTDP-4-dehydrorhamnose 3,5-epimerase [Maribacter hydrothermalis]OBR41826.1 dTDP-4-dehydrorhamnose 3,5-epimerase [Maribacter hydrothermalis]